ncbi:10097_t:CDS:2 [Diversispora eburnea]|uniref:10097_t:CDS:1 n=1 Tax=Diversispora eburnea TaxID=1213867 RepID=A0A9N9FU72_9GLOM|nr:10097_t:CDS:2 [Diversispora eburnea]
MFKFYSRSTIFHHETNDIYDKFTNSQTNSNNYSIFTQSDPDIPSLLQTTTTSRINCSSCEVDTSVGVGSTVTSTASNSQHSIFITITSSALTTGPNIIKSRKTSIFLSTITILIPGYTTTFEITQNGIETSTVYIPPSTVVVVKEATAKK